MFTPDITLAGAAGDAPEVRRPHLRAVWLCRCVSPDDGWVNPDVIGIDLGITLLSAENLRTGRVWTWFMKNPEITTALDRAGVRIH